MFPVRYELTFYMILSRVRGSVTNNNGLWTGWSDLLALLLQLQPIIAVLNQRLPKTRSITYWATGVFSSTVTEFFLIYEPVTSSDSVVRWLTLRSWTLNHWTAFSSLLLLNYLRLTKDEWRTKNDSRIRESELLYDWRREDGPVIYICCWTSPAHSFSGSSLVGLGTKFYSLRFETSLFVSSYDSQGYGGDIRHRLHSGIYLSALSNFGANRIEITTSNNSSIMLCLSVGADTCLASRCLAIDVSAVLL
jgi:hypothetical protein